MAKTQNAIKEKDNPPLFFGLAAVIILISFLFFSPRVSSMLFPFRRTMIWNNFLSSVKATNRIDPQKFWEFREFYSPGYFIYKTSGLDKETIRQATTQIGIPINQQALTLPFDKFTSSRITSIDSLTLGHSLINVFQNGIPKSEVLFKSDTSIIYKDDNSIKIIFVLPENEMEKAVGFFEYDGKDKEITKGKYWLDITSVQQD